MFKIMMFCSGVLVLKILSNTVFASSFLPENKFQISIQDNLNSMTESEFLGAIKKVESIYAPIIDQEEGAELIVYKSWKSNTVNAYADRSDSKKWNITFYGGLARHPEITIDAFTLVVCHELGHHIGGAPKKTENKWSSAEGQADYFSTLKCLRKVFSTEDNEKIVSTLQMPEIVKEKCSLNFSNKNDQFLCMRSAMAGLATAKMLAALEYESRPLRFETPDENISSSMQLMHPAPQCRLDTYFMGAVCPVDHLTNVDDYNMNLGTCSLRNGDSEGLRPACWFKSR